MMQRPASFASLAAPLSLAALLLLGACSSTQEASSVRLVCPALRIITGADEMTTYRGSGRDLTDVDFTVAMTDASFDCIANEDAVEGEIQVLFDVRRGPANETNQAPFNYFVAVANSEQQILAREAFDVVVPFGENRGRVTFAEVIGPQIPLPAPEAGGNYTLFLGLEISREQLYDYLSGLQ
ncbi:MAG: hypothetical protein P8X61_07685 [Limibacillus sp.]